MQITEAKIDSTKNHINIVEQKGDPKEYFKRSMDVVKTLQDQTFDFEKKMVQIKVILIKSHKLLTLEFKQLF